MIKHTTDLLITKIFSYCIKPRSINEITKKIYGNNYAKNQITIYKTIEYLVQEEFIKIEIQKEIKYRSNYERILSILAQNKILIQIDNNTFKIKGIKNEEKQRKK